ncbi:hypothetical protein HY004_02080 [Candidatus Saccharibacteria bacterium]|nr:hypothetical protein [Candidatus Saccharibacteria bacterium]
MRELAPQQDTVVMVDVHARSQPLDKVTKEYGNNVRYVAGGDSIGIGPDTKGVLDISSEFNIRLLRGNWEHQVLEGLVFHDLERRRMAQEINRPLDYKELQKIAKSYELSPKLPREELIIRITEKMQACGHLNMLARAAMYYETEGDGGFIVVHAGLTSEDWSKQKDDLEKAKGTFDQLPQIFDDSRYTLSNRAEAFIATDKTVITGHTHRIQGERTTADGKRVRLASNQELLVWQSWDKQIKSFQ